MRKWIVLLAVGLALAVSGDAWADGFEQQVPPRPEVKVVPDDSNETSFIPAIECCEDVQEDGVYLSLGLARGDCLYDPGEPLGLLITIHNVASEPQTIPLTSVDDEYQVEFNMLGPKPTPFTARPRKSGGELGRTDGARSVTLQPGGTFRETLPVSKLYDMSNPAEFDVMVSRDIALPTAKPGGPPLLIKHKVGPISMAVGNPWPPWPGSNLDWRTVLAGGLANRNFMAHTPLQESPKASVGPRVYAKYACYNRIIQLVGSRLIVVYLPITFKPDRSMGVPFTSGSRDRPKDRRHVEVSLDSAEVEEFVKLVKDTGFLKLSGHYGAPGSYPEAAVTVALDGRKTTADYRIIPRYTGSIRSWLTKPRAFSRVVDWLLKAATEHVADFAAFRSATNPSHRRQ